MNATHMMIDPNELVIDMPVDEGNVKLKMESLQSSGMVQPVTVWLQDLRIIDGFHRTEAAKRLGWSAIPCNVIDCTEEAFWDARIQSAKQHHAVEEARLSAWIAEAWKTTEWAQSPVDRTIWEQLYLTADYSFDAEVEHAKALFIFKTAPSLITPSLKWQEMNEAQQALWNWLSNKSSAWGINTFRLIEILSGITIEDHNSSHRHWNALSKRYNLSLDSRRYLATIPVEIDERSRWYHGSIEKVSVDIAEQWLIEIIEGKTNASNWQRILEIEREEDAKFQKRIAEEQEKAALERAEKERIDTERREQQRAQWEQTPQGQAAIERQRAYTRLHTLTIGVQSARNNIESIAHVVGLVPDAPAIMADFADFLHGFIAKHLPQLEVAEANPIALENAKLRKENNTLTERVASLERALQSKESTGQLLANAVAWSSTDLDS